MFRLIAEDTTATHLNAARFHARACARYAATQAVGRAMAPLIADAKAKQRAWEDARDAESDAHADLWVADADADDLLRALWADAMAADRKDASLALAKALFPEGLTPAVRPVGLDEGAAVDEVAKRLADPRLASQPLVKQYAPLLAKGRADVTAAGAGYVKAKQATAAAGVMVDMAKSAIREQLEASFGALHEVFKAQPARAERFFMPRNGGRRRVAQPAPHPEPGA